MKKDTLEDLKEFVRATRDAIVGAVNIIEDRERHRVDRAARKLLEDLGHEKVTD